MFSGTSNGSGVLWSEDCSGTSSSSLVHVGMRTTRRPQLVLNNVATEDDDSVEFDTSDTDNSCEVLMAGQNHYPSIQEFASAIPNHLLLGSLLEHLCFVYESNPTRSRMLFKVIGQRLAAMNLLSPLAISDEFSTVRLQHNRAFTELLHAASSSLYSQGQQLHDSNTHNTAVRPKEGLFQAQTSRYLSEFEEISRLGKGSYGNVYKVLNKLDGQFYAVKKILIKNVSKEDCMKVLREVKVLSSLQHVNVVGYHTAWMEHVQPAACWFDPASALPALESPGLEDISAECRDDHSSSSSIVFQSLSQPPIEPTSSDSVPQQESLPVNVLTGQVSCPKNMTRIPENYVPCVFLGQKAPTKISKCPAIDWDTSAPLEESDQSSSEVNNNSLSEDGGQLPGKHVLKPLVEVQFHLMLYIQMQLCERSLMDWMTERNAKPEQHTSKCPYAGVDPEHTTSLLRKVLEGVEYIHSKGIMHRDLKPRNIFLHGHDCHVRIGDFGLACSDVILESSKSAASPGEGFSHTSGVGTFVYAAPEQLKGCHYDSKSDMYSVGVLALELFQPFGTEMERVRTLSDLKEGKIPEAFLQKWPALTKYIRMLTSHDPGVRPTASQLLQSELFNSKDLVIHGLQRKVEEQEQELMELRKQISQLRTSQTPTL
ncbi:eukaryotic translation initiation factor 2-alpha kinase 1 [Neosynchiropus ocellatus]